MTSTPPPAAAAQMPASIGDIARSVLMALGPVIVMKGWASSPEWASIVGGLVAALSAAWSWAAAHPSKGDPLAAVRALVAASGPANARTFDGGLTAAEALALAQAMPVINKVIAAHIPALIRGPVESAADKEARSLADQAVAHLKV